MVDNELVWAGKPPSRLYESVYFDMLPALPLPLQAGTGTTADVKKTVTGREKGGGERGGDGVVVPRVSNTGRQWYSHMRRRLC